MTHPAVYAITLGVALGAAIFAYFAAAQFRQENPHHSDWRYKRTESEPWGGSRSKSGRENCTICLEQIDKAQSIRLRCLHEFHRKCIMELRKTSNLCPNCRAEF